MERLLLMLLLSGMEGCMCGWDGQKKRDGLARLEEKEDRVGRGAREEAGLKRVVEMGGRGTE